MMGEPVQTPVGRYTGETTAPVESATVMLLRDRPGSDGPVSPTSDPSDARPGTLQVFMLERHIESDFAGGAFVFPGGKVDDRDQEFDPLRWSGLDLPAMARHMGADEALALGWHVAAVRETFEEAGFLLATRAGRAVGAEDLDEPGFVEARHRLADRDSSWDWREWLADEDLVLDLGALVWWGWWVTPHGLHKRYETRFFAARVPENQVGAHDDVETVDSRWMTPAEALEAGRSGGVTIVYPTRKNLEALERFDSADAAIAVAAAGEVELRRVLPEIVQDEDGAVGVRHPFTGEIDAP